MYRLYSGKYTRGILVEMVMAEGEIEFERIEIDILRGEERESEYLAINSAGWVPALVCPNGAVLTETPAINLYLGERHGITSLVPAVNDPDRARFLSSLFYITDEIEPALKRYWYPYSFGDGENTAEAIRKRALATALSGFALVDSRLDAGGPCHLGERFSLVDLMIAFWAITFERTDEMRQLPRVLACVEMARARNWLAPLFDIIDTWGSDFTELTKDL
jgi:glutathione S-transferase